MSDKDINRIKLVLVEKKKTNKWLAEKLGKDQTTISKWCTNSSQPDINNLMKISKLLDVDISELLRMDNCEICKSN
nr:helix-turn-helix transcriptional regulator [uncultured Prevotella sp.]